MVFKNGIWLPSNDEWYHWGKNWEKKQYDKLKISGGLCLDIGSHVGIWTRRLSKDFDKVICFEPLKKHIDCHIKNCEGLDNITLHKFGLSDTEGHREMFTKDYNSGMSTLEPTKMRGKYKTIIETKRLDSFKIKNIDFMKIDVEGHEEKMLMGAEKTILKSFPKLFIEIWPKNFSKVSNIIINLGYAMKKIADNNYFCVKINQYMT